VKWNWAALAAQFFSVFPTYLYRLVVAF